MLTIRDKIRLLIYYNISNDRKSRFPNHINRSSGYLCLDKKLQSSEMEIHEDIVIVGAGLAGLTTALGLHRYYN